MIKIVNSTLLKNYIEGEKWIKNQNFQANTCYKNCDENRKVEYSHGRFFLFYSYQKAFFNGHLICFLFYFNSIEKNGRSLGLGLLDPRSNDR